MHRFRFSKLYNYLFLGLILIFSFTMVGLSSWNVFDMFNLDYVNLEPVCFNAKQNNKEYYTIEGALKNAKSGDTIYTYIGKNPTIRKSVEIKSGVTLCIPFENTNNTWNGKQSGQDTSKWFDDGGGNFADCDSGSVAKRRKNSIKIAKNVTLTNKGNLYIGGVLGQENAGLSGHTSGAYCELTMDSNSQLINTGTIQCLGYIKEVEKNNNSKLFAQSGKIYTPFVVHDFRGGTSTVGTYQDGKVSPFSVFSMPNIQVQSKFTYDSNLIGLADLYTGSVSFFGIEIKAQHNCTDINIIGKSSSLIMLADKNAYLEAKYDSSSALFTKNDTDSKTIMNLYGGASNGAMKMEVTLLKQKKTINTSNVLFPISYKYDISLYNGTYNFTTPIKLLNGSKLFIDNSAYLNVNSDFIIYSKEFIDVAYGGIQYPKKPNAELIANGSITYNKANGGLTQTLSTKANLSYIYENSSTLSISSREGYGTRDGLSFPFTPTQTIEETAQAKLATTSGSSIGNLEKTVYVSESGKDYFVKASNLGKYTINYHLDGGSVDGETATNDIITKEYPILKDKENTLTDYALSSPKKRFYSFSGWRRDSPTGASASGQKVRDGTKLDVYASYELKTYSITYNVQYAEGLEMSDKYQNTNPTEFTLKNLPLTISKPTDGNLEFYGWYFNNDTSKETLEITEDMEGVGYDDIGVNGYFSDKTMCAIRFDANGHDDYFENLASFNTVSNDPTAVILPDKSLYDDDPTKEYYLIGWEDPNGNMFPGTHKVFETKTLVLKAKWGNKLTVTYNVQKAINNGGKHGETSGQVIDFIKPGESFILRNEGSFNDDFGTSFVEDENFKSNYTLSKWECNGEMLELNSTYSDIRSNLILNGVYIKDIRYKLTIIVEGSSNPTRQGKIVTISSNSFGSLKFEVPKKNNDITQIYYVSVGDNIKFNMSGKGFWDTTIYWKVSGGINENGNTDGDVNKTWIMTSNAVTIDVNWK